MWWAVNRFSARAVAATMLPRLQSLRARRPRSNRRPLRRRRHAARSKSWRRSSLSSRSAEHHFAEDEIGSIVEAIVGEPETWQGWGLEVRERAFGSVLGAVRKGMWS